MQRIIAYIYRYKGEGDILRKCGNVGFCRVEEVNGNRIINMCFKETRNIDRDCKIKGLNLNKDMADEVCGCSCEGTVGNYEIKGGQMRLKFKGDKEDGLLMETADDKYVVMWSGDKEALYIKNVEEPKKIDEYKEKEESKEVYINEAVSIENTDKIKDNAIFENKYEKDINEEQLDKKTKEEKKETKENINTNLYNMLERAYNRMAKVPVIIDKQMHQAVKLHPHQMVMLPRKYWRLTNNGFLMECFYIHKHILFFKHKGEFVIGAPARETVDEEMYATRYGFQCKISIKEYGKGSLERNYCIMNLN